MNLMTFMVCAVALWTVMYTLQVRYTPATSRTAATQDVLSKDGGGRGGGGGSSATAPGGWYSSFSNFGASELLYSSLLFALTLGLPLGWMDPILSLFGASMASADMAIRFAVWVIIVVVLAGPLKRWFSIEMIEAILGPVLAYFLYLGYGAGTPIIKHYIDIVARAFGVGVG